MKLRVCLITILFVLLVACDQQPKVSSASSGLVPRQQFEQQQLALGKSIYQQHCLVCHNENAAGTANWKERDDNGNLPPPPLNGNGHAWHHSREILHNVIKNGSDPKMGSMPAMNDKLSDKEIYAVISWFQSLWPEEVYSAWYDMQQGH